MLPFENGQHNQTGVVTGDGATQVVALEPAHALPHGIRLATGCFSTWPGRGRTGDLPISGPGCAREWVRKGRGYAGDGGCEVGSVRPGSDGLLSVLLSNGRAAGRRVAKFNCLRPISSN
jgi:hypothetical protein